MKKEIVNELIKLSTSLPESSKNEINSFFNFAQSYYGMYTIQNNLGTAKRVLQNYIPEENHLSTEEKKEKQREKRIAQKGELQERQEIDLITKLYIEYFQDIYTKHYKSKYKWSDIIFNLNLVDEILNDYWEEDHQKISEDIKTNMFHVFKNGRAKLNNSNIHNAMIKLEEALQTTLPSVEDTLTNLFTIEYLQTLHANMLYSPDTIILNTAPVRIALTTGTIHKGNSSVKSNTKNYFDIKCTNNLSDFTRYIYGSIDKDGYQLDGLSQLLDTYKSTKKMLYSLK